MERRKEFYQKHPHRGNIMIFVYINYVPSVNVNDVKRKSIYRQFLVNNG